MIFGFHGRHGATKLLAQALAKVVSQPTLATLGPLYEVAIFDVGSVLLNR